MPRHVWRSVADIARRQSGVASRAQLLRAGLSSKEIKTATESGRFVAIYRGVYAIGHTALSDRGRAIAALLATGPYAVASHRTAAPLHHFTHSMPAVLEVTLTRGNRRSRPGLIVHRPETPPPTTRVRGVPVTTPLRTLGDLGFPDDLVREALARGLVRPDQLPDTSPEPTRSVAERAFLNLVKAAGLPKPSVNRREGDEILDFVWAEHRVIVETDGWQTHGPRAAFEADRARDARHAAAGWITLRFTYRQIVDTPARVTAQLAAVLAQAAAASASNSSVYDSPVASATGW